METCDKCKKLFPHHWIMLENKSIVCWNCSQTKKEYAERLKSKFEWEVWMEKAYSD